MCLQCQTKSPNENTLRYLKRKLKEPDDQKEKKIAKKRNAFQTIITSETDEARQKRDAKVRENVSRLRVKQRQERL